MKDYQNKIIINDEEYYVRTEPIVIDAGENTEANVYTSYTDPTHDIVKITPADLKKMFEMGLPIYYNYTSRSAESRLITSATYTYDGEDLVVMELVDANGSARIHVYFYDESEGPQPEEFEGE